MATKKVLIVGAGIAGLAAGTALGQRGFAVDIIEARPDNAVRGIGISVPANALRVLDGFGVLGQFVETGLVWDSYRLFDANGEDPVVVPMPERRADGLPSYLGVSRPAYADILAAAAGKAGARISYGTTTVRVDDDGETVEATLSDGRQGRYDLLVGADGVRSATRGRLFPDCAQPVYSGAAAWRVEVPRPPGMSYMSTYQGVGSKAGLIPINEHSMYLFFVDAHRDSQPENVGRDPGRFREILTRRLGEYGGIIGRIREDLPPNAAIVHTPFERVLLPAPWHRGRSVVIGDAAHSMSANISQGASSALEDAVVLAAELTAELVDRDPVEDALTRFGRRRYPRVKHLQDLSHRMLQTEVSTDPDVIAGNDEERAASPTAWGGLDAFLSQPL